MNIETYLNHFKHPTEAYQSFARDYIQKSCLIGDRGEEDITVWDRLQGKELEVAKDFIIVSLKETPRLYTIRAAGYIKDRNMIPLLQQIVHGNAVTCLITKLSAARALYDWIGLEDYTMLLKRYCTQCSPSTAWYFYLNRAYFLKRLSYDEQNQIVELLQQRMD